LQRAQDQASRLKLTPGEPARETTDKAPQQAHNITRMTLKAPPTIGCITYGATDNAKNMREVRAGANRAQAAAERARANAAS